MVNKMLSQCTEENLLKDQEWQELTSCYLNKEQESILLLKQALAKGDFEQIITLADQMHSVSRQWVSNHQRTFSFKFEQTNKS